MKIHCGLYLVLFFTIFGINKTTSQSTHSHWANVKRRWSFKQLCDAEVAKISNSVSIERLKRYILPVMLPARTPGSRGSLRVQQVISNITRDILGWTVEYDTFQDKPPAPYPTTQFTNIIATHNPNAKRRLVLACHFDTKVSPTGFVGATDSAVPCSMMIEIAVALRSHLRTRNDVTLELVFFDGEEAFVQWSNADSLYGSRHLADRWQKEAWPPLSFSYHNRLDSIDLLLLLDLIGAENPRFYNSIAVPSTHFNQLIRIEKKLYGNNTYFQSRRVTAYIEDDHLPFYRKGVPILHAITRPFPTQWHTLADNFYNLEFGSIEKLTRIFAVFVAEYLHLDLGVPASVCGSK